MTPALPLGLLQHEIQSSSFQFVATGLFQLTRSPFAEQYQLFLQRAEKRCCSSTCCCSFLLNSWPRFPRAVRGERWACAGGDRAVWQKKQGKSTPVLAQPVPHCLCSALSDRLPAGAAQAALGMRGRCSSSLPPPVLLPAWAWTSESPSFA